MELCQEFSNPNGLKIFLASKFSKINENLIVSKISQTSGIRKGACLKVSENGIKVCLEPNSAALFLMPIAMDWELFRKSQTWIDWETSLESLFYTFLSCPKEGKRVVNEISNNLKPLDEALITPASFLLGQLTAVDIIIYARLFGLLLNKELAKLLQAFPNISDYLKYLGSLKEFNEAEQEYFKGENLNVLSSSLPCEVVHDRNFSSWNLLRKKESNVQSTSNIPTITKSTSSTSTKSTSNIPTVTKSTSSPQEEREISETELSIAEREWNADVSSTKCKEIKHPILPANGENNIMITSALPYVNNVPHLGNIIGCVLSADCFARFCRLRGDNVLFICGTDEYGTATETKARNEGVTPKEICVKYHKIHSEVYDWFNCSFDHFGRTTTRYQTEVAQSIFWDLERNKKLTKNIVEQLFCSKCEMFLADRFVEGVCPHVGCGFEDARGDQCDGCGKLVNAIDLIDPRCKFCSQKPIVKQSQHLFLDLPKIETDLERWFKTSSQSWSSNAKVICESWLRDGLKERCITRDLKWGTPVPMEGFREKVFYVWYDAPIGYISITMEYTKEWSKWWMNPDTGSIKYYQFMAKDNVPFHGVIFPSTLLGTNKPWTKVTHLMATEYLNYEDGKFSKSRGVGVFGDQAKDTGIVSDVWRFYLLYLRPETQDTAFSWVDLQTKNNSELLNNVGNFVNRSLKFVWQYYGGKLPDVEPNRSDYLLMAAVNQELDKYWNSVSNCRLRDGIRIILSITRLGNQYIQENEPYKLIKPDRSEADKKRGATVINISANIVGLVGVLTEPYMPDMSRTILTICNHPPALKDLPTNLRAFMKAGHKITEPYPLVRKITDEEIETLKKMFAGSGPAQDKKKPPPKGEVPSNTTEEPKSPEEIQRISDLVTAQGTKVRDMKAAKASKEDITNAVATLLDLKKQLALAQGIDTSAQPKGKAGKKKNEGTNEKKNKEKSEKKGEGKEEKKEDGKHDKEGKENVKAFEPKSVEEIQRIADLITAQGTKVRELKQAKAEKDAISLEVSNLLALKRDLSIAQGIDPDIKIKKDKKK